ncbi:MAG: radical SAM protein, partial [Candidatus Omnitrophica bacterium]|nr:radical SAM protein [Candidatus Omnitrophota bacterium]
KTGFLRISQGCRGDCSYCLEKELVGPLKSKSIPQAEKELLLLLKKGYKNVSLVSDVDDTGSYGLDIKSDYPTLLRRLVSHLRKGSRLKLASMDPFWVIKYQNELLDIFKSDKISYAHIAIQSASNRLFRLMRRNYKIEKVEQILKKIREKFPNIYLATTVIIGFPCETNKDFQKTLSFLGKGYFDEVYLRRYYETGEVDSYKIKPKIPQFVIEKRYKLAVGLLQAKKIKISKED